MIESVLVASSAVIGIATARIEPRTLDWPGTSIPNFSDWNAGDIVLVHHDQTAKGLALSAAQRISSQAGSRGGHVWTHAAIYVGNGAIVEAVPGDGVVKSSVWKYCCNRDLRVRRLDAPFSIQNGIDVAEYAVALIGQEYSMREVVMSKLLPAKEPDPERLYCSTFVGFVINAASGFSLYALQQHKPLQPSILATHPDLVDVPLAWCQF